MKFFADDTTIYSIAYNPKTSATELNIDLEKINDPAFRWKMSYNPDPTEPANEILFSHKNFIRDH